MRVEWEIRIQVCLWGSCPELPPNAQWWSSACSAPSGPTNPWPLESSPPNVLCISLAFFKFYPFPLLILTFYHLNYTDGILRSLAPPLVCVHLATHCTLSHFTFLSTSISDLIMDMDKVPPPSHCKITICPGSFRSLYETLKSGKICTRIFLCTPLSSLGSSKMEG